GREGQPRGGGPRPRAAAPDLEKKAQGAAEQDRPDVRQRRREWAAGQPGLDVERLVFLDETWAATNMCRRYGRAPAGQRLVCPVPPRHLNTTPLPAALP